MSAKKKALLTDDGLAHGDKERNNSLFKGDSQSKSVTLQKTNSCFLMI